MCGLIGVWHRHGAPDAERLQAACGLLHHRGPDHRGIALHGRCGLGHTRLSIIDLAGGDQPLIDADGEVAVIANGEIYNHVELRAELEARGHRWRSGSDCEAIVHGYREHGDGVFATLRGMYAIAIHDRRNDRLLLARDRLGIKPLFYCIDGERLLFASEIKALLAMLGRTPPLRPEGLAEFLDNQFCGGRETVFAGIHRVLPGEWISVDASLRCRHQRYWRAEDIPPGPSEDEAMEAFGPLFEQVMREHMRSDVPFGLYLSGGVDSAVLLAELSRLGSTGLRTYSVGWDDAQMADELAEAERIAAHFGAEHTSLRLSRQDVFARAVRSIWAADELMRDYASLPTLMLSEVAGDQLKVVFSGEGGDEVFGGYRRYFKHPVERALRSLLAPGSGGFRIHGQLDAGWLRRISAAPLRAALPAARRAHIAAWQASPRHWTAVQRSQFCDLTGALPDNLLVKADRMMMSCSIEGRVPLLDHRVVEFGLRMPDASKRRDGHTKAFLKRWAATRVPPDHVWQPKRGFYVPVRQWLDPAFTRRLKPALLASRGLREWFDPEQVGRLLDAHAERGRHSREVWSLMQFGIWHRLFVEGPMCEPGFAEDPVQWLTP